MKNLIPHFIYDRQKAGETHGSLEAYTMFVDMSGFTRLTEVLLQQGKAGAERLSDILNAIFEPMVGLVYSQGGFIPYFAGDSFIGIFPTETCDCTATNLLATAIEQFSLLEKSSSHFSEFNIGIKTGLSFGKVEWGIVGKAPKSFYFKGSAIQGCANSQSQASQRQIIADKAFVGQLPPGISLAPCSTSGYFLIAEKEAATPFAQREPPVLPELLPEIVRQFLPQAVIEFNQKGEFRTVVSVFISFDGEGDYASLNELSTIILDHISNFSGYFKEIDFGDKGAVLVIIFGAPVSHENNVERALKFVCAIQDDMAVLQQKSSLRYKIGMAEGIAYTGIVGGKERCQYAAVGNRVNIAARLMMHAGWGEILVDEAIEKNRHFRFQHRGNISYKGLKELIPTFQLTGRSLDLHQTYEGNMVGREPEVSQLESAVLRTFNNSEASVAYVYGEPGIGKSRLTFELHNYLRKKYRLTWLSCQSDQILSKPFNPFIYFLKNYFEQSSDATYQSNLDNFEKQFSSLLNDLMDLREDEADSIRRELVRTKPVLAALTGLKTSNSLWESLDAKGRYLNILSALSSLFLAEALIDPVVLELEDGHWFDESSIEFLNELAGRIRAYPIFVLVTSRYDDQGAKPKVFSKEILEKAGISSFEIDLNILDSEAIKRMVQEHLQGEAHPDLLELLMRTTNGNPFYAEQMLEYFQESNLLKWTDEGWSVKDRNIGLSNSIQAVLTARIDRLSNLVKETVKAAAVIGREFELPVLSEVMRKDERFAPENGSLQTALKEQVRTAERAQIWQAMNELRYIFRHSLLRETVYDMQLKTRLRELHQLIAEAIENLYAGNLEQRYVDLVFHYEQAGVESKWQEYLEKAADHSRSHYQNQQALHFYNKLIDILERKGDLFGQAETLLKKAGVLELIGRWEECEAVNRQALELTQQTNDNSLLGWATGNLGHLLMLQGKYEEAEKRLETSAVFFDTIQDKLGTSKTYGNLGNLYFRQGRYEDARLYFIQSLQLAQRYEHSSSNAQIAAALGLTYMNLGKYNDGIRWQQSHLELCKKENDKQGMATLYVNIGIVYFEKGDYDAALDCYQRGLTLAEELGNKQLISIAIGSIGNVWQRKGKFDIAMQHFERDLALANELGDKQGISIALGLIGELLSVMGRFDKAIEYIQQNLRLGEELGYRKGVAKSLNTLGDIYFFKNEFETSIEYYDRSIEMTESIGNKLVLGFSLAEKAIVLLAINRVEEAREHLRRATAFAEELRHPDLLFETRLLAGRIAIRESNYEEAQKIFTLLLELHPGRREEATIHAELSKVKGEEGHREKALEIFRQLYEETPMHIYKLIIEELSSVN